MYVYINMGVIIFVTIYTHASVYVWLNLYGVFMWVHVCVSVHVHERENYEREKSSCGEGLELFTYSHQEFLIPRNI